MEATCGGASPAITDPGALQAAVAELLAADPTIGIKKLVVALRQAHPGWCGGSKEVRQAKAAHDAASSSAAVVGGGRRTGMAAAVADAGGDSPGEWLDEWGVAAVQPKRKELGGKKLAAGAGRSDGLDAGPDLFDRQKAAAIVQAAQRGGRRAEASEVRRRPARAAGGKDICGSFLALSSLRVQGGVSNVKFLTAEGLHSQLIPGKPVGQVQAKIEAAYQKLLSVVPMQVQQEGKAGIGAVGVVHFIRTLAAIAEMIEEKHVACTRRQKVVKAQLSRSGKGKATDKFCEPKTRLARTRSCGQLPQLTPLISRSLAYSLSLAGLSCAL